MVGRSVMNIDAGEKEGHFRFKIFWEFWEGVSPTWSPQNLFIVDWDNPWIHCKGILSDRAHTVCDTSFWSSQKYFMMKVPLFFSITNIGNSPLCTELWVWHSCQNWPLHPHIRWLLASSLSENAWWTPFRSTTTSYGAKHTIIPFAKGASWGFYSIELKQACQDWLPGNSPWNSLKCT